MKRIICHICIALTFSFALLTTCLSVHSFAKETVETMPEIIVTATRIEVICASVSQWLNWIFVLKGI